MLKASQLRRSARFLSKCPHPNKVRFTSFDAAEQRANEIGGLKAYKCVCGQYHMTTDVDNPREPECPICGAPIDEYSDCGCYNDIMFGD